MRDAIALTRCVTLLVIPASQTRAGAVLVMTDSASTSNTPGWISSFYAVAEYINGARERMRMSDTTHTHTKVTHNYCSSDSNRQHMKV